MDHVFISYNKKHDRDYARRFADRLLEVGFDVWIDDRIDFGDEWWAVIVKAIRDCAAFVVIMTPHSDLSEWVQREVLLAMSLRKSIFPVLLEGELIDSTYWTMFIGKQYVDVRSGVLPNDDFYRRLEREAPCKPTRGSEIGDPPVVVAQSQPTVKTLLLLEDILPPPFEWIQIPGGRVALEDAGKNGGTKGGVFKIPAITMAKYPVTNLQYQVFVAAADGYHNPACWQFSESARLWRSQNKLQEIEALDDDHPRTHISWYEAVAFCHWLSAKTGLYITLPTERQWQRAAIGNTGWRYPWGDKWDEDRPIWD
ncbi:MAG: SUMF1/EgtB/PvdO family nonheme iron enzyme, partial [Chloroflexota bacterium]